MIKNFNSRNFHLFKASKIKYIIKRSMFTKLRSKLADVVITSTGVGTIGKWHLEYIDGVKNNKNLEHRHALTSNYKKQYDTSECLNNDMEGIRKKDLSQVHAWQDYTSKPYSTVSEVKYYIINRETILDSLIKKKESELCLSPGDPNIEEDSNTFNIFD